MQVVLPLSVVGFCVVLLEMGNASSRRLLSYLGEGDLLLFSALLLVGAVYEIEFARGVREHCRELGKQVPDSRTLDVWKDVAFVLVLLCMIAYGGNTILAEFVNPPPLPGTDGVNAAAGSAELDFARLADLARWGRIGMLVCAAAILFAFAVVFRCSRFLHNLEARR